MSEAKIIRVLLADDHPHGREGIREIISADPAFEIIGEAVNGEQAVMLAAEHGPDLVLMDINMPVMNGMEATQSIKAIDPRIKIVMVTVSDDIADLFEAVKRGAQGYLLKNLSPSAWLDYLRAIAIDEIPLSKELAYRLLQEFSGAGGQEQARASRAGDMNSVREVGRAFSRPEAAPPAQRSVREEGKTPLTVRERDVLERVASGSSNRQIAEDCGISENTVKNHLKNILQKLHLDNRVQLTRYAVEKGLLRRGGEFTD
ncbi:response regulator [Paenibacillus nasutitermitis]|uniref:DNA-binding response regulator n=1 Tax=Paenibacillus nasutitermitis TaxID=1652958 RepID=A0A916YLT1_9BACL|nr:response regulator transcription factor [Paenibacillus nasutitermitis]GGD48898.1 DNA-binding response regulator [Paenibacillus nasutitermitis]